MLKRTIVGLAVLMGACAATPEPVPDLAGSEWGPAGEAETFVRFGADGALSAGAGCNSLGASYTQDGAALKLSPIRSTRMMCPPPVMERERALVSVLEATVSVAREDDGKLGLLVLRDADGVTLMRLQRRDWD